MKRLEALLIALHEDETAVTSTEYVVILVLIACGSILTLQMLGGWSGQDENEGALREFYSSVHEEMSSGQIRGGLSAEDD